MWISRAKYETLESTAKNNEYDAKKFRDLIQYIKEKKTAIYHDDFILISRDIWNELSNKYCSEEDRVKDIQAELEWYKIKYQEMKLNAEQ